MSHPALCVVTLGLVAPDVNHYQGWQPYGDARILLQNQLPYLRQESLIIRAYFE
jgi:hypothetical protein